MQLFKPRRICFEFSSEHQSGPSLSSSVDRKHSACADPVQHLCLLRNKIMKDRIFWPNLPASGEFLVIALSRAAFSLAPPPPLFGGGFHGNSSRLDTSITVNPFSYPLPGWSGSGAYPSCHRSRGKVYPG